MKNVIIKLGLAALLLISFGAGSYSQKMFFCKGVDKNGNPEQTGETFYLGRDGKVEVTVLVKLGRTVGCDHVNYLIEEIFDDFEYMELVAKIKHDNLSTTWTYFWKKITFSEAGFFYVEAKDCNSKKIASSFLYVLPFEN